MKKLIAIFAASMMCVLFGMTGIQSALAVEFFGDEELYITEPVLDDAYAGGAVVNIDDNIEGDLFVAGGSITINGDINGDLVMTGGQITVNGNVSDDLRAAGGSIFLNGNIGDDVIATSGQLNISADTLIGGSLIIGNGYANILGTVNEDVLGGGGKIIIGGTIYRDVVLEVQDTITLTNAARINGNFVYTSIREAELDIEQVAGYIEFNKQVIEEGDFGSQIENFFSRWHLFFQVFKYLSVLALALVLVFLFPACLVKTAEIATKSPWKSLGLGLVISICTIAGAIVLSITLIGLPIAMILIGIFLITLYAAKVFAAAFIGKLIIRSKKMTRWKLFGLTALGAFVLIVVDLVPFVGWLVGFLVIMLAFGAFWIHKKQDYDKLGLNKI